MAFALSVSRRARLNFESVVQGVVCLYENARAVGLGVISLSFEPAALRLQPLASALSSK